MKVFISTLFFANHLLANTLKIAVLDNLMAEDLASRRYEAAYRNGLKLAKAVAEKRGIKVVYRFFEPSLDDIQILKTIPQIKQFNPHLVVAPRYSGPFLILRDQFKARLIISPTASANTVKNLPRNFDTVSPLNEEMSQALVRFIKQKFPKRRVYPVVEVSCKYCTDFSKSFRKAAESANIRVANKVGDFLGKEVERVELADLLAGAKDNDLFLLPNRTTTVGKMMARIANHLKTHNLVFLGADSWRGWNEGFAAKFQSKYNYRGYRITPWSLELNTPNVSRFKRLYQKFLGSKPDTPISYASFLAVHRVTKILDPKTKLTPKHVLNQYLLKQTKKTPEYALFHINQNGETFLRELR